MHKTILLFLLIITTNPAWADWAEVIKSKNSTYYIDQTNIRKNGQFVKVWVLKNSSEEKYSTVTLMENDCNEERWRYLSAWSFSGQMRSGTSSAVPVEKTGHDKWEYIPPQTVHAFIQPLVCHEWVKVEENVYFDTVSIRRNGQFVTAWILFDNLPINSEGVVSTREYHELDCKGLKVRRRFLSGHSDSMAAGNVVFASDLIAEWRSSGAVSSVCAGFYD